MERVQARIPCFLVQKVKEEREGRLKSIFCLMVKRCKNVGTDIKKVAQKYSATIFWKLILQLQVKKHNDDRKRKNKGGAGLYVSRLKVQNGLRQNLRTGIYHNSWYTNPILVRIVQHTLDEDQFEIHKFFQQNSPIINS